VFPSVCTACIHATAEYARILPSPSALRVHICCLSSPPFTLAIMQLWLCKRCGDAALRTVVPGGETTAAQPAVPQRPICNRNAHEPRVLTLRGTPFRSRSSGVGTELDHCVRCKTQLQSVLRWECDRSTLQQLLPRPAPCRIFTCASLLSAMPADTVARMWFAWPAQEPLRQLW
jgi:hypothetical protein